MKKFVNTSQTSGPVIRTAEDALRQRYVKKQEQVLQQQQQQLLQKTQLSTTINSINSSASKAGVGASNNNNNNAQLNNSISSGSHHNHNSTAVAAASALNNNAYNTSGSLESERERISQQQQLQQLPPNASNKVTPMKINSSDLMANTSANPAAATNGLNLSTNSMQRSTSGVLATPNSQTGGGSGGEQKKFFQKKGKNEKKLAQESSRISMQQANPDEDVQLNVKMQSERRKLVSILVKEGGIPPSVSNAALIAAATAAAAAAAAGTVSGANNTLLQAPQFGDLESRIDSFGNVIDHIRKKQRIQFNEDIAVYEIENWKKYNSRMYDEDDDADNKCSNCAIF